MILRSGTTMGSDEKRRRISAAAISVDLLLSEVLARLPAKSIARCRCVCRSWRDGIAGAAFVRRHREFSRARPPSSVLAIPLETYDGAIIFYSLRLPPPGRTTADADLVFDVASSPEPDGITRLRYLGHCDGLVAITTMTDQVFVCNPATGESVELPPGRCNAELGPGRETVAPISFDRWRNSYVVARYFYRTYGDDIGHEVFTLGGGGGGGSWELTKDPPLPIRVQRPVCTRRGIYWHSDEPEPRLLRFGLRDRAFEVVSRPPTGDDWNPLDDMADLDGKLCYIHAADEDDASLSFQWFQLWMADDDDDDGTDLQWSLRYRIDLPDKFPTSTCYDLMPVLIADDGCTLVACVSGTLCRCNLQNGSMAEVFYDYKQHGLQYRISDGSKYKRRRPHHTMDCMLTYFETFISPTTCNY